MKQGNSYYVHYNIKEVSDQWPVGLMGCRTNGLSDQWAVEPMGCRTNGLSDHREVTVLVICCPQGLWTPLRDRRTEPCHNTSVK